MKKFLIVLFTMIFSMNQMTYASQKMSVSGSMKKMLIAQSKASYGALSKNDQKDMMEKNLIVLDQIEESIKSIDENQIKEVMKTNVKKASTELIDSVDNLSAEQIEVLSSSIDDETLLASNDIKSAVKSKLKQEHIISSNETINAITQMSKSDILDRVKNLKEETKKIVIHDDSQLGLVITLWIGFFVLMFLASWLTVFAFIGASFSAGALIGGLLIGGAAVGYLIGSHYGMKSEWGQGLW